MANTEMQAKQPQKLSFSQIISSTKYQKLINNTLRDPKKAERFVTAITSAVSVNPGLQECAPDTIVSGALLGESLGLSPSPQLGQYHLIPFEDKKRGCKVAQFIPGYRAYVQLALRSGYYKKLNVIAVKEGELVSFNPLTEDIELNFIQDEVEREKAKTIGYVGMFEYLNGFRKVLYWSKEKMLSHADRYSQAFSRNETKIKVRGNWKAKVSFADYESGNYPKEDEWMYSSKWYSDFDAMAFKTLLKQLISKWGIMSVEMQTMFEQDNLNEPEVEQVEYFQAQDTAQEPEVIDVDVATGEVVEKPAQTSTEQVEQVDFASL